MSNSNRARFGPAAKWEGNLTEVTKMEWSPVSGSGHYEDTSYCVSPDGKSWRWSWRQTFYGDTSTKPSVVTRDPPNPLGVAIRALRSSVGVGAVAACKVAAEDALDCLGKGGVVRHKLGRSLEKICKEGAYWAAAAGAFETFEFGAELMRGHSDWIIVVQKNAMIGGAFAGATVSAAARYSSHGGNVDTQQVIKGAITGGAIGTAFEFISHRRHIHQPHQLRTDDATDQTMEQTDEPNPLACTSS